MFELKSNCVGTQSMFRSRLSILTRSIWTELPHGDHVVNTLNDAEKSQKQQIQFPQILDAYKRIKGTVKKSPLDLSHGLSEMYGCSVYLKKEHIGICGAYKERGALNKILQLTPEQRSRGVICSSAGNHAQAVSHHSTRLGIKGLIVMPQTTPFVKVAATKRFGAEVLLHGQSFDEAAAEARRISQEQGLVYVQAFNDPDVVCGQGTVALEMLEQNPFLDAIVVPIGGGGLIAGMALAIKTLNPQIKVYGVEAKSVPGMYRSVLANAVTKVTKQKTMADGIAVETVGDIPFDLVKLYVDEIVLVNEGELASSILSLLEVEKTIVEASGAAGLAALRRLPQLKNQQVGVVTTGGNIDMTLLGRIIEKGLVKNGRLTRIQVTIEDIPGQFGRLTQIFADCRVNVREIEHERAFLVENVGYTRPTFTIDTKDHEHANQIVENFKRAGFLKTAIAKPAADLQ